MKSVKCLYKLRLLFVSLISASLLLSGCNLFTSTEERLQQAIAFQEKGDLNAAAIEFRNVLKQEPEHGQARWLLGKTYLELKDGLSAKKELLKARELGVTSDEMDKALARAHLLTDEPDAALKLIESSPTLGSQPEGLVMRGEALFALNRQEEARQSFLAALEADSGYLIARYGLTRLALDGRDLSGAASQVEAILKQAPDDFQGLIFKAELELSKGKPDQAVTAYQQALKVRDSLLVRLGLTRAYLVSGKPDEADAEISKVLNQAPANLPALYFKAVSASQREDFSSAKLHLQEVLRKAPEHHPSMLLLGTIQFNLGEYEQAVSNLVSYLAEDVTNVRAKKLLAEAYLKLGDTERAIERLESAADTAPNDPQLMGMLGKLYSDKGDIATAQRYYEKSLLLAPGSKEIETRIALNRWAAGEHDEAIADLSAIVSQGDEFMPAELALITAKMQAKDYNDALTDARKLIHKRPKLALGYVMAASALDALKQRDQAREYLKQAIEADPTYVNSYLLLARFDHEAGKENQAKVQLEAALAQNPGNEIALLLLAQLEESAGNKDRAMELVEQARSDNPNALAPRLLLANASLRKNELERAKQLVDEALVISPDNPGALKLAGDVALASNDSQAALGYYDKVLAIHPNVPEIQMKRGTLLVRRGDLQGARATFNEILAYDNAHLGARWALGDIALLDGKLNKALARADGLIKDYAEQPAGYSLKGDVRMREKNFVAASELFRKAYELAPQQVYLTKTANALKAQNKDQASADLLEEWLKDHPEDTAVRISYATQLQAMGKTAEALSEYQQITEKQPDNVVVLNNMAWLYQEQGELEKARGLASRAYEKAPGLAGVVDTYGWILVNSGEVDRGLALLQEAVEKGKNQADIRYHLAAAFAKAGNEARARSELEDLLATQETFAERAEAEKLLQSLR
jgi:putative PEP-CTERM system TPR-repeat lipoprotein